MYCWWEGKLVQSLWKRAWRHFKKVKIKLPYGPAIPRPSVHPKKMKTLTGNDIHEALLIAKIWNQLKCPSIDEWRIKPWCTQTHTRTHRWRDTIQP